MKLSPITALVMVAAARRLTRLMIIGGDSITEPVRRALFDKYPPQTVMSPTAVRPPGDDWQPLMDPTDQTVTIRWMRQATPVGQFAYQLTSCPRWCCSMWAGAVVVLVGAVPVLGPAVLGTLALSETTALTWFLAERGLPPITDAGPGGVPQPFTYTHHHNEETQ